MVWNVSSSVYKDIIIFLLYTAASQFVVQKYAEAGVSGEALEGENIWNLYEWDSDLYLLTNFPSQWRYPTFM